MNFEDVIYRDIRTEWIYMDIYAPYVQLMVSHAFTPERKEKEMNEEDSWLYRLGIE